MRIQLFRRDRQHRLLSCRLLIAALAFSPVGLQTLFADQAGNSEAITFQACEIADPSGKYTLRAECGWLEVQENPQQAQPLLNLHVTRLKSRSNSPQPDPFTLLAGGPGQSASESWPSVQFAFESIRKNRDIYLIDQRGTGRSNKLACKPTESEADPFKFDAIETAAQSSLCRESITADPAFYTTSVAVHDLDAVRKALEIDQWNIFGISYGTRVALQYLRRYEEHVRTMILDAVVPPNVSLGLNVAIDAQKSFDAMLLRCYESDDCREHYPELGDRTRALLEELALEPQEISFENFNTGQIENMNFTLNHLTLTMRMLSYTSHGVSILPNMLREAYENNNFAPFARQSSMQAANLGGSLATGMYNAVICTEDEPYIDESRITRLELQNTYLGAEAIDALQASCKAWPAGVIDDDFRTPVTSSKPVLILSGANDPVTPPAYGSKVAETLENSLHIVNPHQGHMQSVLGCTPAILANFVSRADTNEIDFGCLERLSPEPFFIDANGPTP